MLNLDHALAWPDAWAPFTVGMDCMQPAAKSKFPPGIDMNVSILTSGFWPSYPILEANLPSELNDYQAVFRTFISASTAAGGSSGTTPWAAAT